MSGGFDGFEPFAPADIEDAEPDTERALGAFPDPELSLCPVVPLGFDGGRVIFAMPEGELRWEAASKIPTMLQTDIFACAAGQAFLTTWRDGEDKFQRTAATIWFVRKCRAAGKWDDRRAIRSLGLWSGDGDDAVLHLGDEIWKLAKGRKAEKISISAALRERRGPLYKLRPPAPRPDKPVSSEDGQWARETLDLWRFEAIGHDGLTGADVAGGWLMAALLGQLAPFRGHLLINAMAGGGKTTLVMFIHALLSALAGDVIDSFTEAGLRNDLAGMARPALLDETEASPGGNGLGVVERALELLRRMATGTGGNRRQGDINGGSVTQTAVGAVLMAAINPPKLGPADASRIVEVRLLPLSGADLAEDAPRPKTTTRAELVGAIDKAKALAPAMLGRALKGAWRYRADVDEMSAAMARAGEDPRTGDLVAMLAAGRRLLLFDKALSTDEADLEVGFWRPLLVQREGAESVSNPGADALALLMAADAGVHLTNRRETLGGLIRRWSNREREYEHVLADHGVKISEETAPDGREGPWLLVANQHPKLEAIFKPTKYGDWRRTLGYLDSLGPDYRTWHTPNSVRFGVGVKQRAICIPLTPWLEKIPVRMAAGIIPLPRSAPVPPAVPPEEVDWPDEF